MWLFGGGVEYIAPKNGGGIDDRRPRDSGKRGVAQNHAAYGHLHPTLEVFLTASLLKAKESYSTHQRIGHTKFQSIKNQIH